MSRVLVLAYYFPPLGGAGVQRTIAFVRHLPRFGYESTVVTGPDLSVIGWAPPDEELAELIPASTQTVRIDGPEPGRAPHGWHSRAVRYLRLDDPFERWWTNGLVQKGRDVVGDADVIYASMSPWGSGEAAARLSGESGKPWIADLRDPWALDEVLLYPTALHRRLERRRMGRILRTASAIVANTPEAAAQIRRQLPELRSTPITTIPNGFDPETFAGPVRAGPDGRFRITHAGYVHTEDVAGRLSRLLGGCVRGYDVRTRSHTYLLRAVESLVEESPELRSVLEVNLAGVLTDRERAALPKDLVRAHGYLPHPETVELLRSSDLLFLPMHDLPEGRRARIVPGKTYEYLASRRPILAAVPEGDARDLLLEAGNASVCRPTDVGCMAAAIRSRLEAARAGIRPEPPNPAVLARFERPRLARDLVGVFDGVLGSRIEATSAEPSALVPA
jgi:glycosyltransferase involved in cell wall biosynthesis